MRKSSVKHPIPTNQNISLVVHEIGDLLAAARSNVARQVNNELLSTYWNIGRIIAEYEQTVPERLTTASKRSRSCQRR